MNFQVNRFSAEQQKQLVACVHSWEYVIRCVLENGYNSLVSIALDG